MLSALNSFWLWAIVAAILLILEMFTASSYMLWLAIGAGVTGIVFLIIPSPGILIETIVFAAVSSIALYIWFKFFNRTKVHLTNTEILNQRGNQYIGQIYNLDHDIMNGRGYLKISDTVWQVECDSDLTKGMKVKVIGVNGNRLVVEYEEATQSQ